MEQVLLKLNRRVKALHHVDAETGPQYDGTTSAGIVSGNNKISRLLEETRTTAYNSGFADGRAQGVAEADRQVEQLRQSVTGLTDALECQYRETVDGLKEPLVMLACRMAEKIIGVALVKEGQYETILAHRINKIVAELNDQHRLRIRVNPASLPLVNDQRFLDTLQFPAQLNVKFIDDADLEPGDCIIESDDFIIDAVIENQLELLRRQLLSSEQ